MRGRKTKKEVIDAQLRGEADSSERQLKYQQAHKAAGLCTQCSNPARPGFTKCEECATKNREYSKARRKH